MNAVSDLGNVMRLYWAQERGSFQFLLFNAALLPLTVGYLGLRTVGDDPAALRWWMAASVTMGLGMTGFAQIGFAVLHDRFQGRLLLLRSAPVRKLGYFAAQQVLAVGVALGVVWIALPVLAAIGAATLTPAAWAAATVAAVTTGSATGALAAWMAFRAKDWDSGNTVIAIAALGFAIASPVFYDIEAIPWVLRPIAWLSPFTHAAVLLRGALAGAPVPLLPVAALVALTVLFDTVSYRRLRWQE